MIWNIDWGLVSVQMKPVRERISCPTAQTGRYVFGVHNVVVVEREINLVDRGSLPSMGSLMTYPRL